MTALVVLLGVVVALLTVIVVGLLRSHAEILRRLHDLGVHLDDDAEAPGATSPVALRGTQPGVPSERTSPAGATAHDLGGVTPRGSATGIGIVGAEHATLLVFLSSGCMTCRDFWDAFSAGAAASLPGGQPTRLVAVTKGPEHEQPAAVEALAAPDLTVVMSSQAYEDYAVPVSPYVILVDGPTGAIIGEGASATWAQVSDLLAQAAADAGLSVGGSAADPRTAGRASLSGVERERRADDELARAGIGPGHPSLYPDRLIGDPAASTSTADEPAPTSRPDQEDRR